jgi:hypothetical protein
MTCRLALRCLVCRSAETLKGALRLVNRLDTVLHVIVGGLLIELQKFGDEVSAPLFEPGIDEFRIVHCDRLQERSG